MQGLTGVVGWWEGPSIAPVSPGHRLYAGHSSIPGTPSTPAIPHCAVRQAVCVSTRKEYVEHTCRYIHV
jgi:hypothetical protein